MELSELDFEKQNKGLEGKSAVDIMQWAYDNFDPNRLLLSSSLGLEDQMLTHMILKINPRARIITLDTGRQFQESYDLMQQSSSRYKFQYEVQFPDAQEVETMVNLKGPNLFYESIENRKECCGIRKIKPLKKVLAGADAWITGLRQGQSVTRDKLSIIMKDEQFGLIKINPLLNYTEAEVWKFIKTHKVPYNVLHDKDFPSIGCAPCTRAIMAGEDVRAGRWWWENPDSKECGLHVVDGVMKRKKA